MKYINRFIGILFLNLLIITCIPFLAKAACEEEWSWQYPIPQGNNLIGVQMLDNNTIVTVGNEGTFMKSIDGGNSWDVKHCIGKERFLRSMHFVNDSLGWIVGNNGFISHTSDGGQSWTVQEINMTNRLNSVFFVNDSTGWIVGRDSLILKTENGGITWEPQHNPYSFSPNFEDVFFINDSTGWIVGGIRLLKTTDAGKNWININVPSPTNHRSVYFYNENIGWISCYWGYVIRTEDGGQSWVSQKIVGSHHLHVIRAIDSNRVWIGGTSNALYYSDNRGKDWVKKTIKTGLYYVDILGIDFIDDSTGIFAGTGGTIFTTNDQGNNWNELFNSEFRPLYSVSFPDTLNGWAVGWAGRIIHTSDGGKNWEFRNDNITTHLYGVSFPDNTNGFTVGINGNIYSTKDKGINWNLQNSGTNVKLNAVDFIDSLRGWVVGENGIILHTKDGGINWSLQNSGVGNELRAVQFLNKTTGWATGQGGRVLFTNNGGQNWVQRNSQPLVNSNNGLFFLDEYHGWVVGWDGYISYTTNGGISWTDYYIFNNSFYDVYFTDRNRGWAVGSSVYKTIDGGKSWELVSASVSQTIYDIEFVGQSHAWISGNMMSVLNYSCPVPKNNIIYQSDTLQVQFTPSISSFDSLFWDFGDGNTQSAVEPLHTYDSSGIYTVTLISYFKCGQDTSFKEIIVECTKPLSAFNYESDNLKIVFFNKTKNASGILWDFGNGITDTIADPVIIYDNPGTYMIKLIAYNHCGQDTLYKEITVNCHIPEADFTYQSNLLWADFYNTSLLADNFLWDFGDGNTDTTSNPEHFYINPGIYTVSLTAYNECGENTIFKNVNINCPKPEPAFSFTKDNYKVQFFNETIQTDWIQWDFGDGKMVENIQNPEHTYDKNGTYKVCLMAINVCGSEIKCEYINIPGTTSMVNRILIDNQTDFYPNPTHDHIIVKYPADIVKEIEIELTDKIGKSIKKEVYITQTGNNSIVVNLQDLSPGIYFLKVRSLDLDSDLISFEKIIILPFK